MIGRMVFGCMILLLAAGLGSAQESEYAILTENAPPTNYICDDGELKGSSVEIVREIMQRMGWNTDIEVLPWTRAYRMAQTGPKVILFSMTLTDERQNMFKWVGPIYSQQLVVYKLSGSDLATRTLDDAKQVRAIGAYRNDAAEQLLKGQGFTNLESVNNDELNIKKLYAGKIDLWATGDASVNKRVTDAGHDPEQLEQVLTLKDINLYIAFSKDTPDETISQWQQALDSIKNEGLYQRILDTYVQK